MKTLVVDHSDWDQVVVTGDDRVRFVQGMCTSNVETLAEGGWLRTSLLSAKGRVLAVFEAIKREGDLLLLCEPGLGETIIDIFDRHAIADDVEFARQSGPVHRVWPDPASVWTAPPVLEPAPGPVASAEEVELRRIEAGLPRYGVDVSEDYFPFETPLARHIDYQKGCYTGQEPVARVYSRGSAQKTLRGLAVEGPGAVAVGSPVSAPERAKAGAVTSAAESPDFGSIALAYVHRTVWEPGTRVEVAGRPATVVELPFGGAAGH